MVGFTDVSIPCRDDCDRRAALHFPPRCWRRAVHASWSRSDWGGRDGGGSGLNPRANVLARTAMEKIGKTYRDPHALDDTGQRLSLAEWQQQHGNIAAAATIRVRMAR